MSRLQQVKENGQKVAEAIATVLKVDVEIVDLDLVRVAGTGKIRNDVGSRLRRGLINKHVIKTSKPVFIKDAGHHSICNSCPLEGDCYYMASIVYPIKVNNAEVIGAMSLIAFDEEQKRTLCSAPNNHLEFIGRMADLIGSKVAEREMVAEKIVMANQLQALVDSVHEGVLALDQEGVITHFNKSAEKMFGIKKKEVIGKNLQHLIPSVPLLDVMHGGKGFSSREIYFNFQNKQLHFVSTARPIKAEDKRIVGVVASFRDFSETQQLAYQIVNRQNSIGFNSIIGQGKSIQQVKEKAKKIAGSNSTVLIVGESGTGKEVFARAIHTASPHSHKPFIAINCGAIPEPLLESELFGYDEGAFTGARRGGKPGKIELASGGTLFLDEIGNMSLYLQAKLLRVLQEKQIERVGGTKVIPVDIRIIAATNSDLRSMVEKGQFREDLYYRLNVIPLEIPPLRERKDDILLLLDYFSRRYSKLMDKKIRGLTHSAQEICLKYPWPGNVRELINAIEYAINLEEGTHITPESLPPRMREDTNKREVFKKSAHGENKVPTLAELEREAIVRALEEYGWTEEGKQQAADALGISRATIYRKIQKYHLNGNNSEF
ncbi:sigma 54-interacting transcriptional regulator [Metallumcola ferriviriculae]|uniref:Sigma 54-interacting transcriptional regulator n=1 Tax=Metallumcola ferriviriculae TaxID=3039180 RepID=A0AAU0UVZ7_9FIRM|nr:sigma 54-interacting transcriptional regulator [Desulfitibacteraceae bacterium MK1]